MDEKKVIFLDVDGTLCNESGVVLNSTVTACQQAREKGHKIFISTGRSKLELPQSLLNIGFDGIIAAAGAYVECEGNVLKQTMMTNSQLKDIQHFLDQREIHYIFQSNSGLYVKPNGKEYISELVREYQTLKGLDERVCDDVLNHFLMLMIETNDLMRDDIFKVSFLHSQTPLNEVMDYFKPLFDVIPTTVAMFGENSGEITSRQLHKASAIQEVLTCLGAFQEDTIAFGDGMNDCEMLQYVAVGIAMGNAKQALKDIADDVTDHVDCDGIYKGFSKYKLL